MQVQFARRARRRQDSRTLPSIIQSSPCFDPSFLDSRLSTLDNPARLFSNSTRHSKATHHKPKSSSHAYPRMAFSSHPNIEQLISNSSADSQRRRPSFQPILTIRPLPRQIPPRSRSPCIRLPSPYPEIMDRKSTYHRPNRQTYLLPPRHST